MTINTTCLNKDISELECKLNELQKIANKSKDLVLIKYVDSLLSVYNLSIKKNIAEYINLIEEKL